MPFGRHDDALTPFIPTRVSDTSMIFCGANFIFPRQFFEFPVRILLKIHASNLMENPPILASSSVQGVGAETNAAAAAAGGMGYGGTLNTGPEGAKAPEDHLPLFPVRP